MQRYDVSDRLKARYRIIGGVDDIDVWVFSSKPNGSRWDVLTFKDDRGVHIGFDLRMPKDENFPTGSYADTDKRLMQMASKDHVKEVLEKIPRDQLQRIMLLIQCFAPDMATAGGIYPELRELLDAESDVRPEPNKED
jgi:hypothetical protein